MTSSSSLNWGKNERKENSKNVCFFIFNLGFERERKKVNDLFYITKKQEKK
jgi:hypothetical protein